MNPVLRHHLILGLVVAEVVKTFGDSQYIETLGELRYPNFARHWDARSNGVSVRRGYSILELMIALTLLIGLLAAGWSMLATYRDAELRAWSTVERTQAVRVTHAWLQNDLMHLAIREPTLEQLPQSSSPPVNRSGAQTANAIVINRVPARSQNEPVFVGTSRGFTATTVPSIDPVPFFERMLAGQGESGNRFATTQPAGDLQLPGRSNFKSDDLQETPIEKPLWPLNNVLVEYQLIQSDEMLVGSKIVPVYDLVRREMVNRDLLPQSRLDAVQPSERVLTTKDLYRQNDSTDRTNQALLQENRLPGLTNAEFWYCDGAKWNKSWSGGSGQLPTAVALVFDFAPRTKQPQSRSTTVDFSLSPADKLDQLNRLGNESPIVDEPILENTTESFELLERDVRLVVLQDQRSSRSVGGIITEQASLRGDTQAVRPQASGNRRAKP